MQERWLDPALQGHLLVGLSGPVLSGTGAWPRHSAPGEGPACIPLVVLYLPRLTGCHTCTGPYLSHGGPGPSLLCASLVTHAIFAETPSGSAQLPEPPDWRGSLLPHPSHRQQLSCVPKAYTVPGHLPWSPLEGGSPSGPSSDFFPSPTPPLGCRSPEVCEGGGERRKSCSPAHRLGLGLGLGCHGNKPSPQGLASVSHGHMCVAH